MPVINPLDAEPNPLTEEGPCTWPLDTTCVAGWADYPPNVQSAATSWAVYILWALTGRRFGTCPTTIRPCGPACGGAAGYLTWPVGAGGTTSGLPWMIPWIDSGTWRNCGCTGGCTCAARCEVAIPGPVAGITEVRVDGLVLDPSAYRLDLVRSVAVLVRTDGGCWPDCQDMDLDLTEPGTFSVTYDQGVTVPVAGRLAAGELAGEFAKACSGADCVLPQQLASLTRNGVEVQVADPVALFDQGLTGLANVDLWIKAVNPARRAQRSRVYSPDIRVQRRVAP